MKYSEMLGILFLLLEYFVVGYFNNPQRILKSRHVTLIFFHCVLCQFVSLFP